jgi:membrane-associated phospholipid phosphatase
MKTLRIPIALLVVVAAMACGPDSRVVGPQPPGLEAARAGVPFAVGLASPAWQTKALELVAQARLSAQAAGHAYPILGVAQYLAVQEAEDGNEGSNGGRSRLESDRGAVAGASAVVLTYLFPAQAQTFEDMVVAQANAGPGGVHPAFVRGEAIGRAVGAGMVARAQADGFNTPFPGPYPTGPGLWTSNTTPPTYTGGSLPYTTPWFLTSASQFRPDPPPAYMSPDFVAALAEIKQISDTRTAEQRQIAIVWAQPVGTPTTPGFWLGVASASIAEHGLSEREATHLYALLSATMLDAQISCWDAKTVYWFVRPWAADPSVVINVVPEVGRPNHPSYPSGHSCVSSSAAVILGSFFPEDQAQLDAMVIEAGLSRMYAGIHYRFDIDVGRQIGRSVGAFAMAADASGNSILTPH